MRRKTRGKERRKLSILERQLEQVGAYGEGPPLAERKSALFIVAGVLLGAAVGLLAIFLVAFLQILVP